jgi:hypothetical protein
VNPLLAGAGVVMLASVVALVAWLAALPGGVRRLVAAAACSLLAWVLMPVALETGLRDLAGWLAAPDRARDLAALGTIDGMATAGLATRALWGVGGPRERRLLDTLPPLGAPVAVFGSCLVVAYLVDTVDYGVLRMVVAAILGPAVLVLSGSVRVSITRPEGRLQLRLAAALLQVAAAAVLAGLVTVSPGGTAAALDGIALAAVLIAALLIAGGGMAWERRRSRT